MGREEEVEEESTFVWHQNWFPVCLENDLNKDGPNQITLLVRGATCAAVCMLHIKWQHHPGVLTPAGVYAG